MALPERFLLAASGDLRQSANELAGPRKRRWRGARRRPSPSSASRSSAPTPTSRTLKHGFIACQKQGMDVFAGIDPEGAAHRRRGGLAVLASRACRAPRPPRRRSSPSPTGRGEWPGLVGMLNLNGSLTKAGVSYSHALEREFRPTSFFLRAPAAGCAKAACRTTTSPRAPLRPASAPRQASGRARRSPRDLLRRKAIMGVFDEGCMGMYNAIIPDELLFRSASSRSGCRQSALLRRVATVTDAEARGVYDWLIEQGHDLPFRPGRRDRADATTRCSGSAGCTSPPLRIADEFGCDAIGIQYQQGLKDLLPASDLAEGLLNNADRPPVMNAAAGSSAPASRSSHFNEVDECAGLDALFTNRVHRALGQPAENTLHDIRWGDSDRSGTTADYVWVLLDLRRRAARAPHRRLGRVGSPAPAADVLPARRRHRARRRQARRNRLERIFVEARQLRWTSAAATSSRCPQAETERRWKRRPRRNGRSCTRCCYGVTRDQMMARHKANHVQVAYANSAKEADLAMCAKAALAAELGLEVSLCGSKPDGSPLLR